MTPSLGVFQDPILSAIARVLKKEEGGTHSALIARLAAELHDARAHSANSTFTRSDDPILQCIKRVLGWERFRFRWSRIVFLGCSAGGDVALRSLLGYITYPHVPLVIAMHHRPGFHFMKRFSLANQITQRPLMVKDEMAIKGGRLYFVPGERAIGFKPGGSAFELRATNGTSRFRPHIDQVLASAAERYGEIAAGVILSGMLSDGAEGLEVMFLNHCDVLIQDPATALFKDMPNAAIKKVPSARVLSLKGIADRLSHYSREYLDLISFQPFQGSRG